MSMILAEFNALPFQEQTVAVWKHGTFVATRYKEEDTIALYHMNTGFFVELYYNNGVNKLCEHLTTFTGADIDRLEDYTCYVRFDDLKRL